MLKSSKHSAILAIILIFLSILCSCSGSDYADGVSCASLSNTVKEAWNDSLEYAEYGENYLEYFFDGDSYYDDFSIIYTVDTGNIDELGIFHAPDSNSAEEIYEDALEYIENMREDERAFIASYAPEELPKLDGAEVRTIGSYVVYVIASKSRVESAMSAIEESLRK